MTRTGYSRTAAALVLLGALGCSSNPEPGSEPGTAPATVIFSGTPEDGAAGEVPDDPRSTAARYDIPPGHLPPPGQCRIWMPGEPPGQQKKKYPVGQCSRLRAMIPAGAWLVYRPTDNRKHVRVWQYGAERQVLAQRIYDAVTGELIRHVAPTGS